MAFRAGGLRRVGVLGRSPKCVLVWGPRRDARPAGERRSGEALEGCLSHRDSDPTWSKARDDAYAQKERPGGEPYRPSPPGDSATPKATTDLLQKSFNSFYLQKSRPRRQARRKLDGEGGRGGWGGGTAIGRGMAPPAGGMGIAHTIIEYHTTKRRRCQCVILCRGMVVILGQNCYTGVKG